MTTTPLATTDSATLASVSNGLAALVWWTFSGTRILPPDLAGRVAQAGLDPASVKALDPVAALHRAVREFSVLEGKRKLMEAVVAHEDDTSVIVNLLQLQSQSARKMAKLPVDTLVWDKVAGSWQEPGAHEKAAQLRAAVADRQQNMDGNDVRDLLVMPALARSSAFTLRRGMYVVPTATAQALADAQSALQGVESFNLHVAQVSTGQGWEQPLREAAQGTLRDELGELQEQIEGWRDMASRVRSDTREHVLARFQSLRERAQLYSQALEVSLEDLTDEVQAMEQLALDVIGIKDGEATDKEASRRTAPPAPVSAAQALRTTLAAMPDAQLRLLWDALCDGKAPEDRAALVEGVATAREAQAAA